MSKLNGSRLSILLQQAVQEEHIFRGQTFPDHFVASVLRFGGIVGCHLNLHEHLSRCMDLARQEIDLTEKAGRSFHSGTVYAAQVLEDGKGRFGRHWYAPVGGIWLCLVLVNTLMDKYARLLPLTAGVACCETARYFDVPAHLKWVNDVHVEGKKLAGILTETTCGAESCEEYILMGIGLNVNNTEFPTELAGQATSLRSFRQATLDVEEVMAVLLSKIAWNIGLLAAQEKDELRGKVTMLAGCRLIDAVRKLSDTVGRKVGYGFNVISDKRYTGRVVAIDDWGGLVVQLPDGTTLTESSGEIVYVA